MRTVTSSPFVARKSGSRRFAMSRSRTFSATLIDRGSCTEYAFACLGGSCRADRDHAPGHGARLLRAKRCSHASGDRGSAGDIQDGRAAEKDRGPPRATRFLSTAQTLEVALLPPETLIQYEYSTSSCVCKLLIINGVAPRHGFEPRFTAPKAAVLPLDDRGIWELPSSVASRSLLPQCGCAAVRVCYTCPWKPILAGAGRGLQTRCAA